MSTIDPADAQRTKRLQRAGDRRFLAWAVVVGAVMAAGAFLLGLAIASTADLLRHFTIDSTFDDRVPYPMFWGAATLGILWSLGMAGTLIGSMTGTWLIDTYRGGEQQPRILTSLAACAVAAAVVLDAPTWLAPLEVGVERDPVFHEDKPWSVFGWAAYYADLWVPGLAVVIAGLVVAYAIQHYRALRHQIADRSRLLREGRRTRGAVTGVKLRTTTNDQGQRSIVGADVTVRFTDAHGAERWVVRFSRGRASIPSIGFAQVLFDPQRPGEDELIFVSFHPDPTPPEWIGAAI